MFLGKIRLQNFRSFKNLEIIFHPDINIIFGLNGQGKTSILEAIYFLSITKSFKAKVDLNVLNHEEDFFDVKGLFLKKDAVLNELRVYFSKSEGKHVFIDNKKVKIFSKVVGMFPVILLSLEDIELTFGVPASRRKFLDVLLSQLYPSYLFALKKYKKSLLQKNKLLSFDDYQNKFSELDIWNKQLVGFGAEIFFHRLRFIFFLDKNISKSYNKISGNSERINILYKSNIGNLKNGLTLSEIEKVFSEALEKAKSREIKRQSCLVGPHLDDIDFIKDDFSFKSHGSQGENKSFLIALKLLESQYILDVSKKKPLFLLDDIFGELDNHRIENLLKNILDHGQVFITTTDDQKLKSFVTDKTSFLHIENYSITQ